MVVVSVEDSLIYVHRGDASLPVVGVQVTVQPPRFLESLLQCWKNEELAMKCFSWAAPALVGRDSCPLALTPSTSGLRNRQRAAYSLLSYRAGFLWRPPGTGKTTTAAAMVADLINADKNARVLLIAPTNSAVDQLLVATDDRISLLPQSETLRQDCARIGSNFIARYYEKRRHLLPEATDEVLSQKACLEAAQPSVDDAERRAEWRREMDKILASLRSKVEMVLRHKRVIAMTATFGTMHHNVLHEAERFDLIVFDEASQLGRAICLMLAPLARRALIAGDPYQLAPIFTSTHPFVRKWFGHTLFDGYMRAKHASTCFLNEQSRMALAVYGLVSEMFYGGELEVSQDLSVLGLNFRDPQSSPQSATPTLK